MSLTKIKILENIKFNSHHNTRSAVHTYEAGLVIEVPSAVADHWIAKGVASTDLSAPHNTKGTNAGKLYFGNGFIPTSVDLTTTEIDGVEHKHIELWSNINGAFNASKGWTGWVPTAVAHQIVASQAGQLIHWPDRSTYPPLPNESLGAPTKLTVT